MNNNKVLLIIIAVLLVLSIITTGVLIYKSGDKNATTKTIVNTISVSSKGKVTVLPDVGYISLGIETKNPDVKLAENQNSTTMEAIMVALTPFEIAEEDIKTVGYNIYPQYEEYGDEKPQNYVVSNNIEVTVKNLEDISDIIDAAIEAGANRTNSIRFDVLDREASYNVALEDAVINAKARAEVLADAAGLSIIGVVTVNENSSSPQIYYADVSYAKSATLESAAAPPISTGDMEITANVSVTYEVAPK